MIETRLLVKGLGSRCNRAHSADTFIGSKEKDFNQRFIALAFIFKMIKNDVQGEHWPP